VYFIKSVNFPNQKYIGCTDNIKERLETHNSGGSIYTKPHRPWVVATYMAFQEEKIAREFEKYLKSGAGRAFANKRFW
jgi:predicted GIY-YIG superfamily endonuclease